MMSQEEPQSWSHSVSGLVAESSHQQNHPVTNLAAGETPAPLDKVTSATFHLTPLVEHALPPHTVAVGQETSLPADHSAQDVQRAAATESATTMRSSPEKGVSGVYSAPISASVRDIVASKEEQGLMISGLEEVRQSSS